MENAKKYFFGPLASSAEVMIFWVMHYIEAKQFLGGQTQGAPCVVNKIFILDLLFLGAFCL
jgi:hypothetical protein